MSFLRSKAFVVIVGVIVLLLIGGGLYYGLISSKLQDLAQQKSLYDQNAEYLSPSMLSDANKKVADAKATVARDEAQWDIIQHTKNPVIDMSDIFLAWRQLTNELDFTLGPLLEHQLHNSGVRPLSGITLGGPPNDPNAITSYASYGYIPIQVQSGGGASPTFGGPSAGPPMGMGMGSGPGGPRGFGGGPPMGFPGRGGFPGGGFPGAGGGGTGSIKVVGTFPAILHHVADWNNFSRIALIDGLSLSGNSPNLTGSYNITVYEFPINTNKVGKAVPSGGGSAGAGGGGMPGGAMGMPMGGPPGARPPGVP